MVYSGWFIVYGLWCKVFYAVASGVGGGDTHTGGFSAATLFVFSGRSSLFAGAFGVARDATQVVVGSFGWMSHASFTRGA